MSDTVIDLVEESYEIKGVKEVALQPLKTLDQFIDDWKMEYESQAATIPLFDIITTSHWTQEQRKYFIKAFYHIRGHFINFMWFLGNTTPSVELKNIILDNIREEFGEKGPSHESMYFEFAKSFGVDLGREFLDQSYMESYLEEFNREHLEWLFKSSWEARVGAFSAYEKLDNVDYSALLDLAKSLKTPSTGLSFFIVHSRAEHFERTEAILRKAWESDREAVKRAFCFIGDHQLQIWNQLSDQIDQHEEATVS